MVLGRRCSSTSPGEVLAVDLPPKAVRGGPGRSRQPPELLTLTVVDFAASRARRRRRGGLRPVRARRPLDGRAHHPRGRAPHAGARRPPRVPVVHGPARTASRASTSCSRCGGRRRDRDREHRSRVGEHRDRGTGRRPGTAAVAKNGSARCSATTWTRSRRASSSTTSAARRCRSSAERVSREGLPADIPKTWVRLLRGRDPHAGHPGRLIANLEASPGGTRDGDRARLGAQRDDQPPARARRDHRRDRRRLSA